MTNNVGYTTAKRNKDSDEQYTPFYAVEPIVKYIPKGSIVWLPFDKKWSAYNVLLKEYGFETIATHIDDGYDFFTYEPQRYDIILSNPPYSKKDDVIKRLYELGKPFCMLLPLPSLQGAKRYEYFKKGLQLLCFDKRISYHSPNNLDAPINGTPFASAYFIGGKLLPKDLVIERLHKYERPLSETEEK